MTLKVALLGLWVLAAAPAGAQSALVVGSEAMERLPLPVAPAALEVDVWAREVRLTTARPGDVVRAVKASRLCPSVEVRDGAVVLRCRTGQVEATLARGRKGRELALSVPRGLPRDDAQASGASWHYPPEVFQLGGACPGTTPEGKAECLLAAGKVDDAVPLLREALLHGNGDFAALRLGDIALAGGDLLGALASYQAAGRKDLWGRLAAMRLCELAGCAREEFVFDSARLSEPLATEVDLRLARTLALQGHDRRAALALRRRMMDRTRQPVCPSWPRVCAGVALAALRHEDAEVQALGLELFVAQEQELGASSDPLLLRAASDAAAAIGAPFFAANVLATATPHVPPSRLWEHLARVASLYEAAGDRHRADVVREYAKARLGRPLRVKAPAPPPPDTATAALQQKLTRVLEEATASLEVAAALSTAGRSRASAVLGARAVTATTP
ncbi:MAG: hypothetical protein AMXMBFR34_01660 [Myxococcaceae bacterium]